MILGMMQPYFLPYLGYYALIHHTDTWVVFDDAQYMRHGWVDRNRVLHPKEGWQYIKVPVVKEPRGTPIFKMVAKPGWGDRILRQLEHYRKRAPYFAPTMEVLREAFETAPVELDQLLVHVLARTCAYLELPFHPILHSELAYDRARCPEPGDWARVVAQELGMGTYVNPPGGRAIFDPADWDRVGIELQFLTMPEIPYRQLRPGFEPHLSVVDAMMFNAPGHIREMLGQAILEPAVLEPA